VTRAPAFVALTATGAALARRLMPEFPGARLHGLRARVSDAELTFSDTAETLRGLFRGGVPIIGICAAGILIRALAPLLADKTAEPPVVALAEDGSTAVPLIGGHRGANALSRALARLTGGSAALTTASDLGPYALDDPPRGWVVANPAAAKAVAAALLAGAAVRLDVEAGDASWLAARIKPTRDANAPLIRVSDHVPKDDQALTLHPPVLALGVGAERNAPPEELIALARDTLAEAGLSPASVALIASLDLKEDEPAVLALAQALDRPARFFSAARLDEEFPRLANPSEIVFRAVGCHGVAEGAALAAAGPGGALILPKRVRGQATLAIARAQAIDADAAGRARGALTIIGTGPGADDWRTPAASRAACQASDAVGYGPYLDLLGDTIARATRHEFALGEEETRARFALDLAAEGKRVVLVSSGDPGIYAMATLVFELIEREPRFARIDLAVEPGVSAMQAAAARAGAPLGHDFCAISLSDLLTPWSAIERRLQAAARGDFVVALYNPKSRKRTEQLVQALAILSEERAPQTPVVVARALGRVDEHVTITTLAEVDLAGVDMTTLLIIGSSTTRILDTGRRQWVFTPRGYAQKAKP
jgi:cobalt-precorrin 5A hydrolase / precorrin-3B C17-methyltransferase